MYGCTYIVDLVINTFEGLLCGLSTFDSNKSANYKIISWQSSYYYIYMHYYSDLDKMTILAKDSFKIPSGHLKNE